MPYIIYLSSIIKEDDTQQLLNMENSFNKIPFEEISEPEKPEDKKVFNTSPDEMNPDYVVPEEESGIIGSGRDQMGAEEFEDMMNAGKK